MRPTSHARAPQIARVACRIRYKLKPTKWEFRAVKVCQFQSSFLFCLNPPRNTCYTGTSTTTQEICLLFPCTLVHLSCILCKALQNLFNQGKVYTQTFGTEFHLMKPKCMWCPLGPWMQCLTTALSVLQVWRWLS